MQRRRLPMRFPLIALLGAALLGVAGCAPEVPAGEASDSIDRPVLVLAHVYFSDADDLQHLVDTIDVLEHADHRAGYVDALLDPATLASLAASGRRVEIDEAQTRLLNTHERGRQSISGSPCYRTVEETYASMNALAAAYPSLVRVVDIGNSYDKVLAGGNPGYDLLALVITNQSIGGTKPRFFLMGGFHAREYPGPEVAMRFAEQMINGYGTDPDATWLIDHYELHVVPQSNPDGRKIAELGYLHRKNNNRKKGNCTYPSTQTNHYGIDLNRNHAFKYGGAGTSTSACNQFYRGPSAASEPETQAIQGYLASIFPDQRGPLDTDPAPATATGLMISLHSYGPQVLLPWAWSASLAPNDAALETLGRKFGYLDTYETYEVCRFNNCLYAATGTTDDWAYGVLGVASYTFEMGTAFFETCSYFDTSLLPGNLPVLKEAWKAARRPYQTPGGPEAIGVAVSASPVAAGTPVTLTATLDDTRFESHGWGTEPTQTVAAARYAIDVPSWNGGSTQAMSAADGTFNAGQEVATATIDTTGLAAGRHIVLVEGQDTAGSWGSPSAVFLDIQ